MCFYSSGVGLSPGRGLGRTRETGLGRWGDEMDHLSDRSRLGGVENGVHLAFMVRRRPDHAPSHTSSGRPSGSLSRSVAHTGTTHSRLDPGLGS